MSLIKFNKQFPWNRSLLTDFLNADDFFNEDFFTKGSSMPAMNLLEKDNNFEVEVAAPGFSKEDFEVTMDSNGLHISAEKRKKEEKKEEGYLRKEFSYNSFKRSMRLPESVNTEKEVKATYKNGLLKLDLLKKEEAKILPQKVIEVN